MFRAAVPLSLASALLLGTAMPAAAQDAAAGQRVFNQFRDTTHQVIVWPDAYKTGNVIYPYQDAKKK